MGGIVGVYIDIATIHLHHEKKARNASAIGKSVTNKSKRTFISLICECQHTDMRFEGGGLPPFVAMSSMYSRSAWLSRSAISQRA